MTAVFTPPRPAPLEVVIALVEGGHADPMVLGLLCAVRRAPSALILRAICEDWPLDRIRRAVSPTEFELAVHAMCCAPDFVTRIAAHTKLLSCADSPPLMFCMAYNMCELHYSTQAERCECLRACCSHYGLEVPAWL